MATVKNHVRVSRPKTAAQLAKKARNERLAAERFLKLRTDQALAMQEREHREAVASKVKQRSLALVARAEAHPHYAFWLHINKRASGPGSAALFFARNAVVEPLAVAS